jgi:uncharacterized protein (DUF4213/DUF364 family)
MIGKYVIVRTYSAGVHLGFLVAHEGKVVQLKDSRRLWYWEGAFTLNAVAKNGVNFEKSKLSEAVEEIMITEAIELIPVAPEMAEKFQEAKSHDPK